MPKAALELFGRLLMTKVRDKAILEWKMISDGRMKGESAPKIREILDTFSAEQREAFLLLVPQIVDTTLHHLLWTLEQQEDVMVHVRAGEQDVPDLKEVSDGLAGELYTDEGWIARYSREKV